MDETASEGDEIVNRILIDGVKLLVGGLEVHITQRYLERIIIDVSLKRFLRILRIFL